MASIRKLSLTIPNFLHSRRSSQRTSLSRPKSQQSRHHQRSRSPSPSSTPTTPTLSPSQLTADTESARRASIHAANEFLHSLIASQPQWQPHLTQIRIDCPHTLSELQSLGHLPRAEGVRACRKLVRIPVLYDEIALFVWMRLAEMARGPQYQEDDEKIVVEETSEFWDHLREEHIKYAGLGARNSRFRFDRASSAPGRRRRRGSSPVSPGNELKTARKVASASNMSGGRSASGRRRDEPRSCYFCSGPCTHDQVPENIRDEALKATRGSVESSHHGGKKKSDEGTATHFSSSGRAKSQKQPSSSATSPKLSGRPYFNRSRSSSQVESLLWQRERSLRSVSSSASSGIAVTRRGSGGVAGRLGSLVKSLGTTLGESVSYGYGGQPSQRHMSGSM